MIQENLIVVTYDISDTGRWRKIFSIMKAHGHWLQLSVFQCRLSRKRLTELRTQIKSVIAEGEDHVLILDLGPVDDAKIVVQSLGRTYDAVERKAVIF